MITPCCHLTLRHQIDMGKIVTVDTGTPKKLDSFVTGLAVCDTGTFSVRNGAVYRLEDSKWKKIPSLQKPVVSLYAEGNRLYAGGKNAVWEQETVGRPGPSLVHSEKK